MHEPGFSTFVDIAPGKKYSNDQLPMPYSSIFERTGIRSRTIADLEDSVVSLGIQAGRKLFETLNIRGRDCAGLVLSTSNKNESEGRQATDAAQQLARHLGINGSAIGLNFACSGFPAAIEHAMNLAAQADVERQIVVITVDIFSKIVDWNQEATAVLFGDRATATSLTEGGHVILESQAQEIDDTDNLIRLVKTPNAIDIAGEEHSRTCLQMNGKALYRHAPGAMVRLAQESMVRLGIEPKDVSALVPHQANGRFMEKIRNLLHEIEGQDWSHLWVVDKIEEMGNVGSSSIPAALAHVEESLIPETVVLCPAIGAGPDFRMGKLSEGILAFRVKPL